jgi:hypothetical protein
MKSLAAVARKKAATASPMGSTSTNIHRLRLRLSFPGLLIRKLGGGRLDYFIAQNNRAHNV